AVLVGMLVRHARPAPDADPGGHRTMTPLPEEPRGASRTAVLVCQARAVAHGRPAPGRVDDPAAARLLRGAGGEPGGRARDGRRPGGGSQRIFHGRRAASAAVVAARRVASGGAGRARGHPRLVSRGAGPGGRAWRLRELAGT